VCRSGHQHPADVRQTRCEEDDDPAGCEFESVAMLNALIAANIKVALEPYEVLVTNLHKDGRITDAELVQLRQVILERGERWDDLVEAALQGSKPLGPDET
jgi:hypothetical protein